MMSCQTSTRSPEQLLNLMKPFSSSLKMELPTMLFSSNAKKLVQRVSVESTLLKRHASDSKPLERSSLLCLKAHMEWLASIDLTSM